MATTVKIDKVCSSLPQKSIGLMFSKKKTLLFKWKKSKKQPIHMLFVFFVIDLFYLNKNKEVIEIKKEVRPFSFYNPKRPCNYLIEAPKGKLKLKLKDKVSFDFNESKK
jgi:uncharacterized membrane protein (UPF0127 family)